MREIIDLSQEIYAGMPIFPGLSQVDITVHVSHENGTASPPIAT